jgi:hypothetical protein
VKLFDHQQEFMDSLDTLGAPARALLFYKTGSGKSRTAMLGMQAMGHNQVVVITPPSTYDSWRALAAELGMDVLCMSHAKFRQKDTKLSRAVPVIADEFHLFGGHKGQGWKKLDTLAKHLQAPLFLLSATPNYNDIERCYCATRILSPQDAHGGYLQFLYTHCTTEQNPFGMEPIVTGFKNFKDAAEFLAAQPKVFYLPDDAVFTIIDVPYKVAVPPEFYGLSYNARRHRIMASQMEQRHTFKLHGLVNEGGLIHLPVLGLVSGLVDQSGPTLIFSNSSRIAGALADSMVGDPQLVTGMTPEKRKAEIIEAFRQGTVGTLIGTATLATGTDGLDKVCNTLIIVDDTDDDALRRQLIGRILPRGDSTSTTAKQIFRLTPLV